MILRPVHFHHHKADFVDLLQELPSLLLLLIFQIQPSNRCFHHWLRPSCQTEMRREQWSSMMVKLSLSTHATLEC